MFCGHCGASIPDGAAFCTECGKPISSSTPSSSIPAATTSVQKKTTVGISAAVGALVGSVGLVIFYVVTEKTRVSDWIFPIFLGAIPGGVVGFIVGYIRDRASE
jgi:uncharacterized membrane protein YvbJ